MFSVSILFDLILSVLPPFPVAGEGPACSPLFAEWTPWMRRLFTRGRIRVGGGGVGP